MAGERRDRIRQYHIWLRLLAKRLWRQPAYVGLLLLIPILGWAAGRMEQEERGGAVAAVCVEEGPWCEQIMDGLRKQESDGVIKYAFCDSAAAAERSVVRAEADCGFVIGTDIAERVTGNDWKECITVYETSGSSITGMAKERVCVVLFRLYSEQRYEDYMREIAQEGLAGEISQDFSEQFVDFAVQAYESHLTDGSTFGFRYKAYDRDSQYDSDTNVITDTAVFPVKGVLAVVIFVSGMCGMLEYDRDRREKRFLRLAPNALTFMVNVWLPTVFVSAAALLCLWISDGARCTAGMQGIHKAGGMLAVWSVGMWAVQIGHLLFYQCVIVAYCGMLGIVLRREETIAAAVPILSLGSLVCAPVFVRLATYLPVFAVLEKMFPATYYLML